MRHCPTTQAPWDTHARCTTPHPTHAPRPKPSVGSAPRAILRSDPRSGQPARIAAQARERAVDATQAADSGGRPLHITSARQVAKLPHVGPSDAPPRPIKVSRCPCRVAVVNARRSCLSPSAVFRRARRRRARLHLEHWLNPSLVALHRRRRATARVGAAAAALHQVVVRRARLLLAVPALRRAARRERVLLDLLAALLRV